MFKVICRIERNCYFGRQDEHGRKKIGEVNSTH